MEEHKNVLGTPLQVCSLDGCSQAPKDGFMASGEMSNPDPQARN